MSHEGRIRSIRLLRVGAVPRALLEDLAAGVSVRLALPCRIAGDAAIRPLPLPGRPQVDADPLLSALERLPREEGEVTAGVTAMDIGSAVFTHHFGRARHGGRAILVSLARLSPAFYGLPEDRDLALRRAVLELLHELGHAAGLGHCRDFRCLMRFAPTVEDIDNRGTTLCEACAAAAALPVLQGI